VVGNVVVDSEEITRNFPEGLGTIEMLCIYEVIWRDQWISIGAFSAARSNVSDWTAD
jgi:hypothetical protein